MDKPHLIIASGGTGGHFYPTLGVACEFCRRGGQCTLLLGGKHSEDQLRIAREKGLDTELIEAGQVGAGILGKLRFLLKLPIRVWRARRVLKRLHGDILLTMGSYVAVPSTLAWNGKKHPLVVHEGNTVMGKANRLAMHKASAVALTLPLKDMSSLEGIPWRMTGMPLREDIVTEARKSLSAEERAKIAESFGLSPDKLTVFVFGGSQGARAVNQMLVRALPLLKKHAADIQFLVATGQDDNHDMEKAFASAGIQAHIEKIYNQVNRCFQLARLVVCRGGASSICELAVYRMPMIIVPLPGAADNHQYCNARMLADCGAARMIDQNDAHCEEKLAQQIELLAADENERNKLAEAVEAFSRPDSTDKVVQLIFDAISQRGLTT